jgi:zinc transport system substrate-binding protein
MKIILITLLLSLNLNAQPLNIFVSVLPQKYFVEKIGGEAVYVSVMVKAGHSPASYEPSPRQMTQLAKADVYMRIGVPFEAAWMRRIRALNPNMRIVEMRTAIVPLHQTKADHAHHESDPHIWNSPLVAQKLANNLYLLLSEMLPEKQAVFQSRHTALQAELNSLHHDIQQLLATVQHKQFIVFHPAWAYFAETYGLQQIVVEHEGKRPGPKALARIITQAKLHHAKVVFVQPQFDKKAAAQVAHSINADLIVLNPLAYEYVDTLRDAAQHIAEALR